MNVIRTDVAVHHADLLRFRESLADLQHDAARAGKRQAAVSRDEATQRWRIEHLRGDEEPTIVATPLVDDARHTGRGHTLELPELTLRTLHRERRGKHSRRDERQADGSACVVRAPSLARGARLDPFDHSEAP